MFPDSLYDDGANDNWDEYNSLDPADPDNYDSLPAEEDEYGEGGSVMVDEDEYSDQPQYDPYNDLDNY